MLHFVGSSKSEETTHFGVSIKVKGLGDANFHLTNCHHPNTSPFMILLCFVTKGINPKQLGNRLHDPNPKKGEGEKYEK